MSKQQSPKNVPDAKRFGYRNQPSKKLANPRRVRGGVKLRAKDGDVLALADDNSRSLVAKWLDALRRSCSDIAYAEGLEYAQLGQIVKMDVNPASVSANVQGRSTRAYRTQLDVAEFSDAQWTAMIEAMSGEAIYAASFLAGRLPRDVEQLQPEAGVSLAPTDEEHLNSSCNCADAKKNKRLCKHAVAVGLLVAQQLARDPLLIFALRGMSVERILDRMRESREIETHGEATAHADVPAPIAASAPPLEMLVDEFWGTSAAVSRLNDMSPPHHVPHALLRRLGPSTLDGKFPLVGLLQSIYDTVAEDARRLRDHAEHIDDDAQ